MKRRISIFGATGSIGQNTLDLVRRDKDSFEVVALTGGQNIAQLAKDAKEFNAQIAVTADDRKLPSLKEALAGTDIQAASGSNALLEAADLYADWIMSAIIGVAGLKPGLRALRHGTTLALANKESLVTAGPLLLAQAQQFGARILPVDSEHSAIFQALLGENPSDVERVIITASGGAFRDWSAEQMAQATVAQACQHPNWSMGQRITIDSASMFNKAMEVIEAKEFFGFAPEQIETVVHPQSLIHALVGFQDGGLMAHVGPPDMRHAIGFALNYPKRKYLPVERLDLLSVGRLDFDPVCREKWPALRLAQQVMKTGGYAGACFNAAKEAALDHFLEGRVGFMEMNSLVEAALVHFEASNCLDAATVSLDSVIQVDSETRDFISKLAKS